MPHPMSEKVLQEILRAFAWDEAALPSENAVRDLAAATGHTHQAIKDAYTRAYQEGAGKAIHGKLCQTTTKRISSASASRAASGAPLSAAWTRKFS